MKWENVSLSSIIEIKKGNYITKSEAKVGPYPVILGGREPAYFINQYNHTGKSIVISRSGASAGYVSFWNEPIFLTDGFYIEPTDGVGIDFLFYLLKSKESQFLSLQSGSAIPHVTPRTIGQIKVFLPPIETQRRIADILSAYDDLIENNRKQIRLLEEAAQRLYKEWFVDLRFPGWETTPIVDGLPEGWRKSTISDCAQVLRRGISPKYNENGLSTVINQKCIRSSIVDMSEARKQDKPFPKELELQDNDTVICSTGAGTLGRVGQVFGLFSNTTIDSHVTLIRANKQCGIQFLYYTLKSNQPYFMGMGKGSTNQLELYRDVIREKEILLPKQETLQSFEKLTQPIHDTISGLTTTIIQAQQARDALLPKLMSGEIEV